MENAQKNLALACNRINKILIHILMNYVFGGEKGSHYLPDDLPDPINHYGMFKLKGEKYAQEILKDYFILRTSRL